MFWVLFEDCSYFSSDATKVKLNAIRYKDYGLYIPCKHETKIVKIYSFGRASQIIFYIGIALWRTNFIQGGYDFGDRNEAREDILDFAKTCYLILANNFFKREEHLITFKSGSNKIQMYYFLVRTTNSLNAKILRFYSEMV